MEKRAGLCCSDGPLHARNSADQQSGWAHAPLMSALQYCGSAQSLHTGALIPNMTLRGKIPPDLCLGVTFRGKKKITPMMLSV